MPIPIIPSVFNCQSLLDGGSAHNLGRKSPIYNVLFHPCAPYNLTVSYGYIKLIQIAKANWLARPIFPLL